MQNSCFITYRYLTVRMWLSVVEVPTQYEEAFFFKMKLCIHSELLLKWNFSSSCMYQIMVKKWYSNYYELVLIQKLHLISMFPVVMHSMKFYSSNSITLSEEHGHICMKWLVWLSSLLRVFSTPVKLSMQFILIKQFTL